MAKKRLWLTAICACILACSPGQSESGGAETGDIDTEGDDDQPGQPAQGPCPEGPGAWGPVLNWGDVDPSLPWTEQNDKASSDGVLAIHAVHLPTKQILVWRGRLDQRLLDIDSLDEPVQTFHWVPLTRQAGGPCGVPDDGGPLDLEPEQLANQDADVDGDIDLFCAGQVPRADGTILVTGGNIVGKLGGGDGSGDENRPFCAYTIDPFTMTPIDPVPTAYNPATDPEPATSWAHVDNTNHARWYPSMVALADGRTIMIGGGSNYVELLDGTSWTNIQTKPQVYVEANASMMQYPSLSLLPSGLVFMHGSEDADATNSPLGRAGVFLNPDANPNPAPGEYRGAWVGPRVLPSTPFGPTGGYAVMYEPGKIMRAGGGSASGQTDNTIENECVGDFPNVVTEIVDLSDPEGYFGDGPNIYWSRVGDMNTKRHFHNLVLLPTGEVLAVGGVQCDNGQSHHTEDDNMGDALNIAHWATKAAEKWNPDSGLWCELAPQDRPRMYHSTALLLPDGRVLSMGGGRRQGTLSEMNGEIFTPPYLIGPEIQRPILLGATALNYGADFTVTLDPNSPVGWDQVDRLTLVKLAATTHGTDMGQQFQTLGAPRVLSTGAASVRAPTSPNEASPGWYMLFAISTLGVPSEAIYVNLKPVP